MIEQYENERACRCCRRMLPVSSFTVVKHNSRLEPVYRGMCRGCYAAKQRKNVNPGDVWPDGPTAWLLPRDERPSDDKALDLAAKAWRYPVNKGNLKWAA